MMASISKLPCEIKENIFSWIRYRDLYEVSVVSEEWWWLTMKTYKGILSEEDELIGSLLYFYNRVKNLSTPLRWFQLVKYANFSYVNLEDIFSPKVLKTFLESRKPIRSLYLRTARHSLEQQGGRGIGSYETALASVLKYFPHLEQLKLVYFDEYPWKFRENFLKIPKGIKQLHLIRIELDGACHTIFEDSESIEFLELDICPGFTFDKGVFKNLKTLSLHLNETLAVHEMTSILDFIRGHQSLRCVRLFNATITKEWLNVFGETIENIYLKDIFIEKQLITELGTDGCYERRVMSFVCSDLRTVKRFTLTYMSPDRDEVEEEDEEDTGIDYRGEYACRPQLMEEELRLKLDSRLSRQVQTITTTDNGPALRDLCITCADVKVELLRHSVPASVKKLTLWLKGELKELSIEQLCEQPQNLEELEIGISKRIPNFFTGLTNLKILKLSDVSRAEIQSILQHCVSLEKLILIKPKRGGFTDLSPTCFSKTIRDVSLYQSEASLKDVLYHCPNLQVLRLSSHLICPLTVPTAIAKLKLFSATFDASSDVRDYSTNLPLVMDSVDVPCRLFVLSKRECKFILAQSESLIEEVHERHGYTYAYCCGIPTRYLKALGMQILSDVKLFGDHLNDDHGYGAVGSN